MSVTLLFTAAAYFKYAQELALMLPGFIPFKIDMIRITGFIEVEATVGLLIPKY